MQLYICIIQFLVATCARSAANHIHCDILSVYFSIEQLLTALEAALNFGHPDHLYEAFSANLRLFEMETLHKLLRFAENSFNYDESYHYVPAMAEFHHEKWTILLKIG